MQDTRNIHNANLLQQAMEQQKIISKADVAYDALMDLHSSNYGGILEPSEIMHLVEATEVLSKMNAKRLLQDLQKQLQ